VLPFAANLRRLILSFHKSKSCPGRSSNGQPCTACSGTSEIGTREHISEDLSVKDSANLFLDA
jgi:hypothetical protein